MGKPTPSDRFGIKSQAKSKKKKSSGCCWVRWTARALHRWDVRHLRSLFTKFAAERNTWLGLEHKIIKNPFGVQCSRVLSSWWSSPQRSLLDPYRGRIILRGSGTVSIGAPQGVWYRDGISIRHLFAKWSAKTTPVLWSSHQSTSESHHTSIFLPKLET